MHASLHGADTLSDGTTTLVLRSTFSKMTYPELMTMLNVTTAALGFQAPRYDFVYLPWAKLAFVNFEDPASCKAYFTVFRNVCNLGAEHPGISAVAEAFVQGLARNLAFFLAKCGWKAVSDPRAPCVFSGGVPVSLAEAIRSHVSQEVLLDEEQRARASRAAGRPTNPGLAEAGSREEPRPGQGGRGSGDSSGKGAKGRGRKGARGAQTDRGKGGKGTAGRSRGPEPERVVFQL
ncbi:UBP19 [Symbiodinium necroappetens]|uniref:UBP19 protein n=1 Tax=Symbiodinium necroappetens TaxID=1628268 RepID=A0A812ISK4_9DINO|nr:UBP19 [Symbiodinium necroappetens]